MDTLLRYAFFLEETELTQGDAGTRDFAAMSFDQLADHAQGLVTSNGDAGRIKLVTAIRTAQAQVRAANWQRWSTVVTVAGVLVALSQHH